MVSSPSLFLFPSVLHYDDANGLQPTVTRTSSAHAVLSRTMPSKCDMIPIFPSSFCNDPPLST